MFMLHLWPKYTQFCSIHFNIWLREIKVKIQSSYLEPLDNFMGIYKFPGFQSRDTLCLRQSKLFFLILELFIIQRLEKNIH